MIYKVKEIKGFIFSASLTDGSTLTLQPGQSKKINETLISDSLKQAVKMGRVTITKIKSPVKEVAEKPTTNKEKQTGGAK